MQFELYRHNSAYTDYYSLTLLPIQFKYEYIVEVDIFIKGACDYYGLLQNRAEYS